jgi:hypothetical protein
MFEGLVAPAAVAADENGCLRACFIALDCMVIWGEMYIIIL